MNLTILSFLFALVLWAPASCDQKAAAPLKQEFDLRLGQSIVVGAERLKINFVSVAEDSRCPEGAQCIWAGNAKIALTLRKGNAKPSSIELNTGVTPQQTSYMGYEIKLTALRPHPKVNAGIDRKTYVATLIVSKD
ncbi:MAG: hypothetical protein ABI596_06985 [Pyrinomonadaceae bacterium]